MSDETVDCQSDYDPNSLSLQQARTRIIDSLAPLQQVQWLSLSECLNRVLAQNVEAPRDVPPYRNSAMDGFACRACDLPESGEAHLDIVGESLAGHAYQKPLLANQAICVTTGAVLPDNADVVVMQERSIRTDTKLTFNVTDAQNKSFVRQRGSDTRLGDIVMLAGQRIGPAQIAVLASLGLTGINVIRRARVAILSTGDELVEVGTAPAADQIYDSNRPALTALLQKAQVECIDLGICADNPDAIRETLLKAAANADLIISSGGVSVGQADYLRSVLDDIGELNFWKISVKPGRPLTFGRIEKAHYFGLPGNPVSTLVTFQQLVEPALNKLSGEREKDFELALTARCESTLTKQAGRQEFQRGVLREGDAGELLVEVTGAQDSHILSSVSRANCLIDLPSDSRGVAPGENVRVYPL